MAIRNGMQASDLDVTWRKSSLSGPQGGNCVEFAKLSDGQVAIRNSRHPSGPALVFTPGEWDAFSKAVVGGEFELHPLTPTKNGTWPSAFSPSAEGHVSTPPQQAPQRRHLS